MAGGPSADQYVDAVSWLKEREYTDDATLRGSRRSMTSAAFSEDRVGCSLEFVDELWLEWS